MRHNLKTTKEEEFVSLRTREVMGSTFRRKGLGSVAKRRYNNLGRDLSSKDPKKCSLLLEIGARNARDIFLAENDFIGAQRVEEVYKT